MGEWRDTDGRHFKLHSFGRIATIHGVAGRWWVQCDIHPAVGAPLWTTKRHYQPFPDLDSAKRWCERELAFMGLEEIA